MTSAYLFKHFNFISSYDDLFSHFNFYKCLCSNASKHKYIILIFSFLVFFLIMTSAYLFKYFNFISSYDDLFSHFNFYKCLCSNASKHK